MQAELTRSEAETVLNELPDVKLTKALNYLRFLRQLPEEKIDALEEIMDELGWSILAAEAAERDWV